MAAVTAPPLGNNGVAPKATISAYLIRSAVVASLCGLLCGFETAMISGTTDWLRSHFEEGLI